MNPRWVVKSGFHYFTGWLDGEPQWDQDVEEAWPFPTKIEAERFAITVRTSHTPDGNICRALRHTPRRPKR